MKQERETNLLIMETRFLTDNGNEQWYSFNYEGQQNEFAKLPNNVVSEAYAEILGESINYV